MLYTNPFFTYVESYPNFKIRVLSSNFLSGPFPRLKWVEREIREKKHVLFLHVQRQISLSKYKNYDWISILYIASNRCNEHVSPNDHSQFDFTTNNVRTQPRVECVPILRGPIS